MKIIAGLGNPGSKYENTRHNAGFLAVDRIAQADNFKSQLRSLVQKVSVGNESVLLVKPQTYMNLSGESIQALMRFYKSTPKDLIVLVDDVNLELGRIRIREKGSHGGQNGLRNIIQHCGPEFTRVRIGVGPVPTRWDLADFVLSKFDKNDQSEMDRVLDKIPDLLDVLVSRGLAECMNQFNG